MPGIRQISFVCFESIMFEVFFHKRLSLTMHAFSTIVMDKQELETMIVWVSVRLIDQLWSVAYVSNNRVINQIRLIRRACAQPNLARSVSTFTHNHTSLDISNYFTWLRGRIVYFIVLRGHVWSLSPNKPRSRCTSQHAVLKAC